MAPRGTRPSLAVERLPRPRLRERSGRVGAVLLPSGRALLAAAGLVLVGSALYAGARSTSVFAVRSVDVRGATPATARAVRSALAQTHGRSLLVLDRAELAGVVQRIPVVSAVQLDRAFPHTLVVFVSEEHPAAVLRRGAEAWLVASSGRVVAEAGRRSHPRLARIWVPKRVPVALGERLETPSAAAAVAAVARIPPEFPARVRDVRTGSGELTFRLASGVDLRLGNATDVELKLAIARRILPGLRVDETAPEAYLDVSVVERPVAGGTLKSEVEVEG